MKYIKRLLGFLIDATYTSSDPADIWLESSFNHQDSIDDNYMLGFSDIPHKAV